VHYYTETQNIPGQNPADPKTFDVDQKKRQEELQDRIERERRRSN